MYNLFNGFIYGDSLVFLQPRREAWNYTMQWHFTTLQELIRRFTALALITQHAPNCKSPDWDTCDSRQHLWCLTWQVNAKIKLRGKRREYCSHTHLQCQRTNHNHWLCSMSASLLQWLLHVPCMLLLPKSSFILTWYAACPARQAASCSVAGGSPGRVQGALPWRWPSQAGSIEEREGIQ